jgi:hypothetical protein
LIAQVLFRIYRLKIILLSLLYRKGRTGVKDER